MLHFRSIQFDGIGKVPSKCCPIRLQAIKKQAMLNKAYESGFLVKAVLRYTGEGNRQENSDMDRQDFLTATAGLKTLSRLPFVLAHVLSKGFLRIMNF